MSELDDSSSNTVVFLQQEHAKTLKGLHTEIHKLQQKCAKLTFELTMAGGNVTPNQETSLIEKELSKSQDQLALLHSQVSLHKEKIVLLEHELQTLRKERRDLQREKQDIIRTTQYQLEEKSTTIAHLVSKLQQTQILLQKVQTATGTPIAPGLYHQIAPPTTPASEHRRPGHITRRLRRAITSPNNLDCTNSSDTPTAFKPPSVILKQPSSLITPPTPPERKSRDQLLLEQVRQPQLLQRALAMKTPPAPPPPSHRSPPVLLPPIQQSVESEETSSNDSVHHIIPPPPAPSHHSRRKRYTLSKGGLNSAPCSLRLMNYSTSTRTFKEESGEEESGEEGEQQEEGMLMIKHHHLNPHSSNPPLYFKTQRKS